MYGKIFDKRRRHVDYKQIIQYTDQFDLWSWFLGFRVSSGQRFCNPLRTDSHPNVWCDFKWSNDNLVVLYDFGDRFFHGMSIFDAIMYRESIEFYDACLYILDNFHKGELPNVRIEQSKKPKFNFYLDYIPWTVGNRIAYIKEDKLFWSPYGISEQNLREDRVASCKSILYNTKNNPDVLSSLQTSPSYAIHVNNHVKVYNPYHKLKWLSTCTEEDIGGIDSLGSDDQLLITKSYKDWRVLKNAGYNTIWLQNEGCRIPFDRLIQLQQYRTKFILFDNDEAGIKASNNLAEYANSFDNGYIPIWYDDSSIKDSADVVKNYSYSHMVNELQNMGVK